MSSSRPQSRRFVHGTAGILLFGLARLAGIGGGPFGCAGPGESSRVPPPVGAATSNGLQLARSTKNSLL